jgi:hypothetical protein
MHLFASMLTMPLSPLVIAAAGHTSAQIGSAQCMQDVDVEYE